MKITGHFVLIELKDRTLRVRGTSISNRIDLAGNGHGWGDLVLPVAQISSIQVYPAGPFSAGHLLVRETDGALHKVRFRRREGTRFRNFAMHVGNEIRQLEQVRDDSGASDDGS